MILNFKEIPPSHIPDGKQDTFEVFAREFLKYRGFTIIEGPDRGADGGRDLIVEKEIDWKKKWRNIRFLVSCKHKAHSTTNVGPRDESNPRGDVKDNGCKGFIAFYSTGVTARLGQTLDAMNREMPVVRYDPGAIERELLESRAGQELALRFFGDSMTQYILNHPLYPTTVSTELPRRLQEYDPDYEIGMVMAHGRTFVSVMGKNPETPPATLATMKFQFHKRRDRKKQQEFEELFTLGKPVMIPRRNIGEYEFHRVLVAAFPWLGEQLEAMYFHPLPLPKTAVFDLVIESTDGDEYARYPGLIFDRIGGTEGFELSNAPHKQPLTVTVRVVPEAGGKHITLSLTADCKGCSVSPALRAYRFLQNLRPGGILRFVQPDTSIGQLRFDCPSLVEPSAMLTILEYLDRIQNFVGEALAVPEQGLSDDEIGGIDYLGRMLPSGIASGIEGIALNVNLEHEQMPSFLHDLDLHEKLYALVNLNEWVSVTIMGREIYLGPILTFGMPTRIESNYVETLKVARAAGGKHMRLHAMPAEDGAIKRYMLDRISNDEIEKLRAVLPEDAMARALELRNKPRERS